MIEKLLIATRGASALRIIRACRELGIKTVVVYSEADRDSLPVLLADEAVCIGKPEPHDSYLNISRILSAAEITHCRALHPGQGFLATNPEFADATLNSGLRWIGPSPSLLRLLSNRLAVQKQVRASGVPTLPASDESLKTPEQAVKVCNQIGLPVVIRPVAENIRRTRLITKEKDIETQVRMCQAETVAELERDTGTGLQEPGVYIEKYLPDARKVEIQILAGSNGKITAFDDREIISHRHKNLVAISPATPYFPAAPPLRQRLVRWARTVTAALNYQGIATVEFLIDSENRTYFYRFNPQLPEFHILTELRYGIDVVKTQLQVSDSAPPPSARAASPPIRLNPLHRPSIACQIYAADPDAEFSPSPGTVTSVCFAGGPGVRVDSHIISGTQIPPFYDYFLGTIATFASEQKLAAARILRALNETAISGIATNLRFLAQTIRSLPHYRT